jgi:hypothetical protein
MGFIVATLAWGSVNLHRVSADDAAVKSTVRTYLRAETAGDGAAACAVLTPGSQASASLLATDAHRTGGCAAELQSWFRPATKLSDLAIDRTLATTPITYYAHGYVANVLVAGKAIALHRVHGEWLVMLGRLVPDTAVWQQFAARVDATCHGPEVGLDSVGNRLRPRSADPSAPNALRMMPGASTTFARMAQINDSLVQRLQAVVPPREQSVDYKAFVDAKVQQGVGLAAAAAALRSDPSADIRLVVSVGLERPVASSLAASRALGFSHCE